MNTNLEISWKSLNKYNEELCGDKVEVIKCDDSEIVILSDGMGSGVKANILSTLTSKILGTMLKGGADISDCVETIAKTLPVCRIRQVAYSTFSILKISKDGKGYLVEYDNPGCVFIRDGEILNITYTFKEVAGKKIREYHFAVRPNDYMILFSDGVIHAGVGQKLKFGWGWPGVAEFIQGLAQNLISSSRLASLVCNACRNYYMNAPGDDTTVAVMKIINEKIINIFSGPPASYDDDEVLMTDFMSSPGKKIISGGTSANIASRILGKRIKASLEYSDPEIPPIASLFGMELVTEGVLTLNRCAKILKQYNAGDFTEGFYQKLDAQNGAAKLAKIIIEDCTHLNMFVGQAMNAAHQNEGLPFDLSIRMRLIDSIKLECEKMGKSVTIKYY